MQLQSNQDEPSLAGQPNPLVLNVGLPLLIRLGLFGLLFVTGCDEPTLPMPAPTHSPSTATAAQRDDEPRDAGLHDQATDNSATQTAAVPAESGTPVRALPESAPGDRSPNFDLDQVRLGMVSIGTPTDGPLGYGVVYQKSSTGFDVITADHVVDGRKQISVQAWQLIAKEARLQTYLTTTVMHREPGKDLAWLRVRASDANVEPLQLAKSTNRSPTDRGTGDRTGQSVWTYQVRDSKSIFEKCEIEQRTSARHTAGATPVSYWRLNCSIQPGLSGGGLVDEHGVWIGIASGNSRSQAHYVDETEISQFLKTAGLK